MKTIGLIGGTTWASTVDYYRYFNKLTLERLGGNSSAACIIHSINFERLRHFAEQKDWTSIATWMVSLAKQLEQAGADCLLLGANTLHKFSDQVKEAISIPLIHIAEEIAKTIVARGVQKVGLLGTKVTMEESFYKDTLAKSGIQTLIPDADARDLINTVIFDELGKDIIREETKNKFLEIIDSLAIKGSEGIILGCTEIPLLIKAGDSELPLFDSTYIHAKAAVDFALGE